MSKKLKLLYAEDDKEVAESIARTISLCKEIESIDIVENGLEAISLFNKNPDYDIIISDIQMPKLNGIEAIKEIKSKNPELYTIITTAYNEKDYLFDSIENGVDKFLIKPLDLSKLIKIIMHYYEEKKIKDEFSYHKDMLILQSKAATLGYMIDAIAHQWKQPLGVISVLNSTIKLQIENDLLDLNQLSGYTNDIKAEIEHMTNTLDEFRTFVRPEKGKSNFSIKESLEKVNTIIKHELQLKNVTLILDLKHDFLIDGYINQFIHIILNLISNSVDAFTQKGLKNKTIVIKLESKDNKNLIVYEDNAGGIPEDIIDKVFEINFTTKEGEKGTGIGLYLSEQIAENHNAKIDVENITNGVRFTISLDKN